MMTSQSLATFLKREFATTLKVMRAYPENEMDFAPHERSSTTKQLMATFVFEMYLIRSTVLGEIIDPNIYQTYHKETLDELVSDFEKETNHVLEMLEKMNDEELSKTVNFAGNDFVASDFIHMMMCDQIHHRGQLSVYIRMAGGKVPSIYGPSADDPGTNL